MKIAIMQPYFFPYIGYFELIHRVDKFIFYDDVAFIKQGWINRNKIEFNNQDYFFSVPLERQSSYARIDQTGIAIKNVERWKDKFFKTLKQHYCKAPFYDETMSIIETTLHPKNMMSIGELAKCSVREVANYLDMNTFFVESSKQYANNNLKGPERVLDICKQENANTYINLPGGKNLYNENNFKNNQVQLKFLHTDRVQTKSTNSIIDWLMKYSKEEILRKCDTATFSS